jgi:hypothetical protein
MLEDARVKLNRIYDKSSPEIKKILEPEMDKLNKTIIDGTKEINDTLNGNSSNK